MAYAMKPTKPGLEETQEQIHKIRITLSSKDVKNLEKGTSFDFDLACQKGCHFRFFLLSIVSRICCSNGPVFRRLSYPSIGV